MRGAGSSRLTPTDEPTVPKPPTMCQPAGAPGAAGILAAAVGPAPTPSVLGNRTETAIAPAMTMRTAVKAAAVRARPRRPARNHNRLRPCSVGESIETSLRYVQGDSGDTGVR